MQAEEATQPESRPPSAPDKMAEDQQGRKNGDNWSRRGQVSSVTYNFEGAKSEIGGVLGMRHEKMKNKVVFDDFIEKFVIYLTANMTGARDVIKTVLDRDDTMARIDKDEPKDLSTADAGSAVKVLLKTEEVKKFGHRKQLAKDNLVKIYGLIWGQCSSGLQTSLKGEQGYDTAVDDHDVPWLLKNVQKVVAGVDVKANKLYVEQESLIVFTTMRQGTTEATDAFINRVKHNAQTLRLAGGERYLYDKSTNASLTKGEIEEEIEKYLSMHVIRRCDTTRFGELQKSLLEGSYRGRDEYPTTLQEVYALLVRQPKEIQANVRRSNVRGGRSNVMFAMVGKTQSNDNSVASSNYIKGTDGRTTNQECYICHRLGHISWYCPEAGNTGPLQKGGKILSCTQVIITQRTNEEVGMKHTIHEESEIINPDWILLDTCSTVSVCCNKNLVRDMRECNEEDQLTIVTNGGKQIYTKIAVLKNLPIQVHFKEESLANIISFRDIANIPGVKITMDTTKERAITVMMANGSEYKFNECPDGLYYYDTAKKSEGYYNKTKPILTPYSFAMTVNENKSFFTKREVMAAEGAQRLQQQLGWPSVDQFKQIVANNLIRNAKTTIADIERAQFIFGTPTPLIQGKMTRSPNPKERIPRVAIPPSILIHHRDVILHIDFFFC